MDALRDFFIFIFSNSRELENSKNMLTCHIGAESRNVVEKSLWMDESNLDCFHRRRKENFPFGREVKRFTSRENFCAFRDNISGFCKNQRREGLLFGVFTMQIIYYNMNPDKN